MNEETTVTTTMTIKELSKLIGSGQSTIRRWINQLNDNKLPSQNGELPSQNGGVVSQNGGVLTHGVETKLTIDQVLAIVRHGKGQAFASLLAENYRNKNALVEKNENEYINDSQYNNLAKALVTLNDKITELNTNTKLLPSTTSLSPNDVKVLEGYIIDALEPYRQIVETQKNIEDISLSTWDSLNKSVEENAVYQGLSQYKFDRLQSQVNKLASKMEVRQSKIKKSEVPIIGDKLDIRAKIGFLVNKNSIKENIDNNKSWLQLYSAYDYKTGSRVSIQAKTNGKSIIDTITDNDDLNLLYSVACHLFNDGKDVKF